MDVLLALLQNPAVISAGAAVSRSIFSSAVACFELARRRLRDALGVLQKATQQLSKGHLASKLKGWMSRIFRRAGENAQSSQQTPKTCPA